VWAAARPCGPHSCTLPRGECARIVLKSADSSPLKRNCSKTNCADDAFAREPSGLHLTSPMRVGYSHTMLGRAQELYPRLPVPWQRASRPSARSPMCGRHARDCMRRKLHLSDERRGDESRALCECLYAWRKRVSTKTASVTSQISVGYPMLYRGARGWKDDSTSGDCMSVCQLETRRRLDRI